MNPSRWIAAAMFVFAPALHAQGTMIMGRVTTDSGVAIVGAEVVLNGPTNTQRTDAKGEFRFMRVAGGANVIGARMPGFAPQIDTLDVPDAGELRFDFKLARIEATLPEVDVKTSPLDRRLAEFHERRRMGIGRFLDSAEFADRRGIYTSDRLKTLPGIVIGRGRFSSEAYVSNNRVRMPGEGQRWCRALVWLDNVKVGTDFNINQLDPSIIAGVEWYAGEASIPARYAVPKRTSTEYCGVLIVWTR